MVQSTTDNTCTTAGATETINAVPASTSIPTATLTQPTCGASTGTIEFTVQAGVQFSVDGGVSYQASTTFGGLSAGDYDLMVRSTTDNTCTTAGATETISPAAGAPVVPTYTLNQPSCATPTGSLVFDTQLNTGYSIDGGTTYQASDTFNGLNVGDVLDLSVRSTLDNTCETIGANITIDPVPAINIYTIEVQHNPCLGDAVGNALMGTDSPNSVTYSWTGPGGFTFVGNPATGLSAGTYTVTGVDSYLCQDVISFDITEAPSVLYSGASITPTSCGIANGEIILNPFGGNGAIYSVQWSDGSNSLGAINYEWSLNGEFMGSGAEFSDMFFDEGSFELSLTVSRGECEDVATVTIDLEKEFEWSIPNTFTPDGDGVNDCFTAKNSHYEFVNVEVFNRWGEMIYEFSGTNINWNGRLKSGNYASSGTYFYIIKYGSSESSELKETTGYVELLR
jgi:gliding motility-associated-like protein